MANSNIFQMTVEQSNNWYRIWHPDGYIVAQIVLPADGQYMIDSKAIAMIVKALSLRYRLK